MLGCEPTAFGHPHHIFELGLELDVRFQPDHGFVIHGGTVAGQRLVASQRRMAAVAHDLSPDDWTSLQAAWGGCAYCGAAGVPLQKDCVLPISRGGRYTLLNVVPACGPCNASKCNDEVTGWLRRKKLDERAFLSRHVEVLAAVRPPTAPAAG